MRWAVIFLLALMATPAGAQQGISPAAHRKLPDILAEQRNEALDRGAALAAEATVSGDLARWWAAYAIGREQQWVVWFGGFQGVK